MISKAKVKYIKSLQVKKYRKEEQSFLVEGEKGVKELLHSTFQTTIVFASQAFIDQQTDVLDKGGIEVVPATARELSDLGSFQTNDAAIAVAKIKPNRSLSIGDHEYALVLDDIRDPGNLGTIVRVADWYGINKIIASEETADFYSPKVISASMGSFTRVEVWYVPLPDFIATSPLPVYGTFLQGRSIHETKFERGGLIVIGNESHGISPEVSAAVKTRITIPSFGKAESLNAATATAVVLDNIRRQLAV